MKKDFFDKFFPIFFMSVFAIMIGVLLFSGYVGYQAFQTVKESGSVGTTIGQFIGDVKKGMGE